MWPGSLPADGVGLGDVPEVVGAAEVAVSGRSVAAVVGGVVAPGGASVPPAETDGVGVADSRFGVTGLTGAVAEGSSLAGAGAGGADPPGVDTTGAGADITGAGAGAGGSGGAAQPIPGNPTIETDTTTSVDINW